MIVDTSALVAIATLEREAQAFSDAIAASDQAIMSAANYVEAAIVIDGRREPSLSRRLDLLIEGGGITIEPVTVAQARIARQAYRDYGKGSGHRAQLNLGDCFAYALAIDKRRPLLFKGDDFRHTDVPPVL